MKKFLYKNFDYFFSSFYFYKSFIIFLYRKLFKDKNIYIIKNKMAQITISLEEYEKMKMDIEKYKERNEDNKIKVNEQRERILELNELYGEERKKNFNLKEENNDLKSQIKYLNLIK
jgi:hypothetical protein